ncbi:hypothetical protein I8748_24235 [Nostoc sp. CENA67]|uniref:Uncharacterized protein n=1 Tax=Amazonocrinis nigriterrae CENA67 TaxID=2794033 RepID=A0A8J7HTI4_9NOST|nr:hypothetical protein [Amazonocrinis nigriterrae]MBH8565252.1 hypothetical protein [Amazonocrinis nigriterrae CENA67]
MKKYIFFLLLLLINTVIFTSFASASVCRNYHSHLFCILSINRSAKNYWEYRAVVSVDGVQKPIKVYNCRERVEVQKDGTVVPFEDEDAGELICSFFKKS